MSCGHFFMARGHFLYFFRSFFDSSSSFHPSWTLFPLSLQKALTAHVRDERCFLLDCGDRLADRHRHRPRIPRRNRYDKASRVNVKFGTRISTSSRAAYVSSRVRVFAVHRLVYDVYFFRHIHASLQTRTSRLCCKNRNSRSCRCFTRRRVVRGWKLILYAHARLLLSFILYSNYTASS